MVKNVRFFRLKAEDSVPDSEEEKNSGAGDIHLHVIGRDDETQKYIDNFITERKVNAEQKNDEAKQNVINDDMFTHLFSILNSTGADLRKLSVDEKERRKKDIWERIRDGLPELDHRERQKLWIYLKVLSKSWTPFPKIGEGGPFPELEPEHIFYEELKKKPHLFPNTYLNRESHENIDEALKLFDLDDEWFTRGLRVRQLKVATKKAIAMKAAQAIFQAYHKNKIEGQDNKEFTTYALGKFIALVCAMGCGLATGFAFHTIAISAGIPLACIGIALFTIVLGYSIGKTIEHRRMMTAATLAVAAALLSILLILFPANIILVGSIIVGICGAITNWFIFSNVPEFLLSLWRKTFPQYHYEKKISDDAMIIDDNNKKTILYDKMSRTKMILLAFIVLIGAGSVALGIYGLFSSIILAGFVNFFALPQLAAYILTGLFGGGTFLGYLLLESSALVDAARSKGGVKAALEKIFDPVSKSFSKLNEPQQEQVVSVKQIVAVILAIGLCSLTIWGILSLGAAASIPLLGLLGSTPAALIIGATTCLFLSPFYLKTSANSVAMITKAVSDLWTDFRGQLEDFYRDTFMNKLEIFKERTIVLYDENKSLEFIVNAALGLDRSEDANSDKIKIVKDAFGLNRSESVTSDEIKTVDGTDVVPKIDPKNKKIIFTKGTDDWHIYYEDNGKVICEIINENENPILYNTIEQNIDDLNENLITEVVYNIFKSRKENPLLEIPNSIANNKLIYFVNASGNALLVLDDAAKFQQMFIQLNNGTVMEYSFVVTQGIASLFASVGSITSKEIIEELIVFTNTYILKLANCAFNEFDKKFPNIPGISDLDISISKVIADTGSPVASPRSKGSLSENKSHGWGTSPSVSLFSH